MCLYKIVGSYQIQNQQHIEYNQLQLIFRQYLLLQQIFDCLTVFIQKPLIALQMPILNKWAEQLRYHIDFPLLSFFDKRVHTLDLYHLDR